MNDLLRMILALAASLLGGLLLAPIALLALPLWLVAAATRGMRGLLTAARPRALPWQSLIAYEPIVGWKPRPHLDAHGEADGVFQLTTDADGWRGRTPLASCPVVAFGDSYVFGFGVDDRDHFAEQAGSLKIKAIGANGYSMVAPLIWMQRLKVQLAGRTVVWMIYYGNDLYENLQPNLDHYRMPFVREAAASGQWEIVTSHVDPTPWSASGRRNYYRALAQLCMPTFVAERAYGACTWLLAQGRDLCRDAGARLIVMGIPDPSQIEERRMAWLLPHVSDRATFDPRLPDRRLTAICAELGLPFVALADHLMPADYKDADVHWNSHGHRRVAELIARLHTESNRAPATDRRAESLATRAIQ